MRQLGALTFYPADQTRALLGTTVAAYLKKHPSTDVWASEIDSGLADTAAFCAHYDISLNVSANCVIIEAKRAERTWYAACIILATTKADVNGVIRKTLDARKASFAPMDIATSLTHMEYGGITPIGLPDDWPILIDSHVIEQENLIIGSGIRGSKLLTTPQLLQSLPNAEVLNISK